MRSSDPFPGKVCQRSWNGKQWNRRTPMAGAGQDKAYGAAIPEDGTRKIILYLQAHYTPDTLKQ